MAVQSIRGVPPSKFSFQAIPELDRQGVDVARDDILQNYISKDDLHMNNDTPWRGPREKLVLFMQMLIEATTLPGDVVLDCTAASGMYSLLILLFSAILTHYPFVKYFLTQ